MAVLESLGQTAQGAAENAQTYAKHTEAYVKLQIFKHIGVLMTFLIKILVIGGLFLTALLFLSVSLMVLLSDWIGSLAGACALVGALFVIAGTIIYVNRKSIDKKVLINLSESLK
ncbi:hypothetical protein [Winogradskyella aurantiaca]|uniref:hypothetical protein n=1 Tax=Winogradskyella aurantiaca TaxID=2219558 RepID=UPI000E1D5FC9|nr:hypothetical protein [Winogradskyella aurantiaca]